MYLSLTWSNGVVISAIQCIMCIGKTDYVKGERYHERNMNPATIEKYMMLNKK